MKVARFSRTRPLLTVTELLSQGGAGPDGQVVTSIGSNTVSWGSNVAVITANGSNQILGPYVNFAAGSNVLLTLDRGPFPAQAYPSNTIRIHSTGGAGGSSAATITYDNSTGLIATNVQDAIDELLQYIRDLGGGPVGPTYADYILSLSGLVGYWRLDEPSGTTAADSGPNNLDMTVTGGATVGQASLFGDGQAGGSFSFDGVNDYCTVNDNAALDLGDVQSMVALIRPSSVSGNHGILSKGAGGYYLRTEGTATAYVKSAVSSMVQSSGVTLTTATTYHVVGTKSGSTIKLYINGVDRTGSVSNSTLADTSDPLTIGRDSGASEYFSGRIAEVALFDRAITSAEVTEMFTRTAL